MLVRSHGSTDRRHRRLPVTTRQMIGQGIEVMPARPSRFGCRVAT
jgi:hypothetical protein